MYEVYAKIRDKRGLTDYDVAKMCGISQSALSRWKTGKSSPSKKTRYKIAQVLGIPLTAKFTGDQNGNFVIEDTDALRIASDVRVATYAIKLLDGGIIELTPDQKDELEKAVDAFIKYYVERNFYKTGE